MDLLLLCSYAKAVLASHSGAIPQEWGWNLVFGDAARGVLVPEQLDGPVLQAGGRPCVLS